MASIVSVGTAVPPYRMTQEIAREMAGRHFADRIRDIGKYLQVFRSALVDERYFCVEPDWFRHEHSLEDKNRLYLEWAEKLSIEAIERCLAQTDISLGSIDHFVFVSSSGIATPSLDVALINRLDMPTGLRRMPLFGLGCAGGAAGIALSAKLASISPTSNILLVAVELNSLTFQPDDPTKSNLVATSLFGDGAAAVLIRGNGHGPLNVIRSATLLRKDTRDLMGWDFVDTGFRVVFSRRVPDVIAGMMAEAVGDALSGSNITTEQVQSFIFHPGGKRILEAYERILDREPENFRASYDVLSRYGNMSSATVLFVLDEELRRTDRRTGDHGLLAAFGPGFSAEVSHVQWA